MDFRELCTPRLDLVPATLDLLTLALWDPEQLGTNLAAIVPLSWPPEGLTTDVLQRHILLATSPEPVIWDFFWVARREGTVGHRTLIGTGGFIRGRKEGTLILGYAVLPEYRGKGYGTEAVRYLAEWALEDPAVERLVAITTPGGTASIRVLEKNGFTPTGDEDSTGNPVFERCQNPRVPPGMPTRSGTSPGL